MKPKIRLKERKIPFISSKEFLKIDAQYIDGEKLLKKIIEDRGKIIIELNGEIKHLTAQIAILKHRCEEQEKNINKLSKEYKAVSKFHKNSIVYAMELEKLLQRNHISYFALRQKAMDDNTEVAKEYDIKTE